MAQLILDAAVGHWVEPAASTTAAAASAAAAEPDVKVALSSGTPEEFSMSHNPSMTRGDYELCAERHAASSDRVAISVSTTN